KFSLNEILFNILLISLAERARPYLTTQDSGDGNDYINAVFVDGYRAKNQYIVTQWPLMWTLCDFWCLVVDFQVSAIALLNPYKLGDQKYPVFWPTVKTAHPSMRFGPIGLELREVYAETDEEPGAFLLSVKKSGMAAFNPFMPNRAENINRDVLIVNTSKWPTSAMDESSCDTVVQMAYLARKWNVMTDETNPILVVSSDGVSRAGVFCAISICMERILAQSEVDVFRAVEIVKQNRPQLVPDLIEYKQCYNCVIRMASLLDDQIKANECERSKDPIEIFDELDRKRAVGELRPELIDTADQSFKQTPNPASRTQLFSPKKLPPPSTPAYPTPTTSPKLVANDLPKHSMPTIYRNQTPRRLPAVTERCERHLPNLSQTRRRFACQSQASVPTLRSHRILPTTARRRLPTLNSIIENPLTSPPSNRTKKVLPPIVNSYTRDEFAQPVSDQFKTQIRCNGSRGTGNDLVALRKPLVRTETETTYLTSLFG
uniref:protein-tyrosine-phosphatase n=1 Tax=Mesocestoides corti TaxID=53468 RepID=A0A5K3EFV1_MESCO